ncbi:MAG: TspO/MBR family protein [Pseudomonadota bacterium]
MIDYILFAIFFATCAAAASTGAMFQPGEWYEALNRPRWTPPNWLFPLAWTVLYVAIAYAAVRVVTVSNFAAKDVGLILGFWSLQITLNTLWSPVFFGLKRLGSAMVVIVFLWLAVAATAILFFMADPLAGAIFAVYLAWCSYAGALNFWIWRAN